MRLAHDDRGHGTPVVLLHGLTATRRYVVMGSSVLERSNHRVVAYDARGHGASPPAPDPAAYRYEELVADLIELLDELAIERAVLAGASMGAHTAVAAALAVPERVAGLVVITPAHDPTAEGRDLARWDALAAGLRRGGVEGFLAAYDLDGVPAAWRDVTGRTIRQRMAAHEHPQAVADALQAVPRSAPFASWAELAAIAVPTAVIADRDEADPGHPLAVGEAWAQAIEGAELHVEEPGRSPLAWQGGQVSRIIVAIADRSTV